MELLIDDWVIELLVKRRL